MARTPDLSAASGQEDADGGHRERPTSEPSPSPLGETSGAALVERRYLQGQGKVRRGNELGGHPFQRWLSEWRELQRDGWSVTVLLSRDRSHVVGIAYRPEDS